jgi:hypothetical protein
MDRDVYYAEESLDSMDNKKTVERSAVAAAPAAGFSSVQTAASGSVAGDQFAFTVNKPVTILRRQSSMIPLVEGRVDAVKSLILQGGKALGTSIHPELSAELSNTTGMKLPAGPITVYDGVYAGDALIEFFSENDKRFISYGEDLSVNASARASTTRLVNTVSVSDGVMMINRRQIFERTYTVKNTSSESKRLIVEHPITGGASLIEPAAYLEKTDSVYRIAQSLPANGEINLTVKEESPLAERIMLGQLRPESLVSYSTNQEIPAAVRAALARAVELQKKSDAARQSLQDKQTQKSRLTADQDRIRQNLSAVGGDTDLGRSYLTRMTVLDKDIDAINGEIDAAEKLVQSAKADLDKYIAGLKL